VGRRLDNSDRGALISVESARRIAEVVRKVEGGNRDIPPLPLRTAYDDGGEVRLCKTTEKWAKDTVSELEVWEAGTATAPEESSPAETITASNVFYDVDSGVFVVIAKAANGRWYLVEAGDTADGSSCKSPAIGGEDLTTVSGYDAAKTQVLGHEDGCLKWIDTTTCPEGSS
jgi:hypothetical protein